MAIANSKFKLVKRWGALLAGAAIVALTGWGAESDRRRTAEAGFNAHLAKPVEPDALRAVVRQFAARAVG